MLAFQLAETDINWLCHCLLEVKTEPVTTAAVGDSHQPLTSTVIQMTIPPTTYDVYLI